MHYYVSRNENHIDVLISSDSVQSGYEEVTETEYTQLLKQYQWQTEGTDDYIGCVNTIEKFRSYRLKAFNAFDIYKSNVQYGIITETELEHSAILDWYSIMLNFPESITEENYKTVVFPSIPEQLERYL